MENLIIDHKTQAITRKVIGCFWILLAILPLITGRDSPDERVWFRSITFFILGVISLTPLLGSTKSQVELCDGYLKIIWMNWIRPVTINESEIERIILAKDGIKIFRKDKKPVKILLYFMQKEQKSQVYAFFTTYAKEKNFS